jgi:hypothetical protein
MPVGPGRIFVVVRDSIPVSIAMSHGWPIPRMSHIDDGTSSPGARRPKWRIQVRVSPRRMAPVWVTGRPGPAHCTRDLMRRMNSMSPNACASSSAAGTVTRTSSIAGRCNPASSRANDDRRWAAERPAADATLAAPAGVTSIVIESYRGRQRDTAQPGPHRCPGVPRAGNLSLMAVDFAAGNWVTPPIVHARLRRGWRRSEASAVVSEHWRVTAPGAIRRWS